MVKTHFFHLIILFLYLINLPLHLPQTILFVFTFLILGNSTCIYYIYKCNSLVLHIFREVYKSWCPVCLL